MEEPRKKTMPPKLFQQTIEIDVEPDTALRSYRITAYTTLPKNKEETEPDIQDEFLATSGADAVRQVMKDHGLSRYFHLTCKDVTPVTPRRRRQHAESADNEPE